jgi:hypothetical protein
MSEMGPLVVNIGSWRIADIPAAFARSGHGRTGRSDPAGRSEHAAQAAASNEPK